MTVGESFFGNEMDGLSQDSAVYFLVAHVAKMIAGK